MSAVVIAALMAVLVGVGGGLIVSGCYAFGLGLIDRDRFVWRLGILMFGAGICMDAMYLWYMGAL